MSFLFPGHRFLRSFKAIKTEFMRHKNPYSGSGKGLINVAELNDVESMLERSLFDWKGTGH